MTVLSFVEKYTLVKDITIALYRGISQSNRHFFAYLQCSNGGLALLKADEKHQAEPKYISDYGYVIYMDFLPEPDSKAQEFLENYIRESSKIKA